MKRLNKASPARWLLVASAALLCGCGGDDEAVGSSDVTSASADATAGAGVDTVEQDTAPAVPSPPAPVSYSGGGECPKLVAGDNVMWSWGLDRKFNLYLPAEPKGAPLLFLWHGLGDNKENFSAAMNAKAISGALGAVVVVPQGGVKVSGWGWSNPTDATEDAALFDDLLSCLDAQYDIDNRRVWTMGFSSGALWSSWLAMYRSTYLAAVVAWSGGTGTNSNKYKTPKRQVPVLLAWGGSQDQVAINFEQASKQMGAKLKADGHFVVLCNHNKGHTIPGKGLTWGLDFLQRHSWGDPPGKFDKAGLDLYPGYCEFP